MYVNNFVHLRIHSDYSMIDGMVKLDKLIKYAKKMDMISLGITDVNNLHGVIKFYSLACKVGIKPIIGVDVTVQSNIIDDMKHKLTLLAANNYGYKNIIELLSESYKLGYDDNFGLIIDMNHLLRFKRGLLVLSGGIKGDIGLCIFRNDVNLLNRCIFFYKKHFPNKYYLEISRVGVSREEEYIKYIKYLSYTHSLPIVATNEVLFLKKNDSYIHKIKVAIHKKKTITDPKFIYEHTRHQYLKHPDKMIHIFHDCPESIINSTEIVKRCNVIIPSGSYFLPIFPTGSVNSYHFFVEKAIKGLELRLTNIFSNKIEKNIKKEIYFARLHHELLIIKKMGFVSYFLIVMEFIKWAKHTGIPVGPGRGSGAGSLVSFALNITEIDPLQFDLLFERFLNPNRVSLPDFDIDFCMNKRDLVIDHVMKTYGRDSVSQIITFGTMAAKAVIRDVGRVLGYPYGLMNKISKLIPLDPKMTLKKAFSMNNELVNLYHNNYDIKILINIAKKLEGVIRNIGKHAGGVVISPTKISDFVPILCDSQGKNQITQFDKDDIEFVGLVKFDFLGLKTLTMIDMIINMINIKNVRNGKKNFFIYQIDLKDKKSFVLLNKSETTSIFQLESLGMKNLIKRLKPDSFEDIIALVALYRPGPLQSGMVDNFINRKHGKEIISYPDRRWQHEWLKPILQSTYGIILYQEQVMQIAQVLSNFTPSEADILRRAMAKKNPKEMLQQRKLFQLGAAKNSICLQLSSKIFDLLEKFSAYGFNKSHSVTYALLAFQTLWLKTNYSAEFMASAMTLDMMRTNKVVNLIHDARRMCLIVKPPNINFSDYAFSVNKNGEILYGLGAIKGLGKSSIDIILAERNQQGNLFINFIDLCIRLILKKITRHIFEILVMSGACDCFNICRVQLFNSIDNTIKIAKQKILSIQTQQHDLFHFNDCSIQKLLIKNNKNNFNTFDKKFYSTMLKILKWEREILGLYITDHPIKNFLKEIHYYTNGVTLYDCLLKNTTNSIIISGVILSIKSSFTKNKSKFYIITLDDSYSRLDIIVFDDFSYLIDQLSCKENFIVIVLGKLSHDSFVNRSRIVVRKIYNIEEYRANRIRSIKIYIKHNNKIIKYMFDKLHDYLLHNVRPGNVLINFIFKKKYYIQHQLLDKIYKVYPDNNFLNYLKTFENNIIIKLNFYK
ncbi:DNA polymerase III subunit alpha [Buchnera aphidicola (Cinara kochiana kochiana)]|uniref:DNA polymerase III subunit alpha n=1 Tax=Buchnera aphidicola (Cinara kochiana kochiana) TaxID=2518976 RepID=A0A451D5K9_9GAMM|nr:DNA polymerase III subunit alpha [Buchnera aphidicola]VFP81073.1 DNA polymerase III subunit alpha [Buchnera aphidicola (Cinara kochiana kochiana)]